MKTVRFLGISVGIEDQAMLHTYLQTCIQQQITVKIAPANMGQFLLMFLFPFYRRRYQQMDIVYPSTRFSSWCWLRFNPRFKDKSVSVEKKIYGHQLFFDLLEQVSKERKPVFFIGLSDNQKYNLQRKLSYCFNNLSDICYLSRHHTRYEPQGTIDFITRSQNHAHYLLIIADPKAHSLYPALAKNVSHGLVFFYPTFLSRYEHNWLWGIGLSRPAKKTFFTRLKTTTTKGTRVLFYLSKIIIKRMYWLGKILLSTAILYYPALVLFSMFMLMLSFIQKREVIELQTMTALDTKSMNDKIT